MKIFIVILSILCGFGIAVLFVKVQTWSVRIINPQYPKFSKKIIIGGAIIRWLIISLFLILALNHSIFTMLVFFSTFMIARLVLLFRQEALSI